MFTQNCPSGNYYQSAEYLLLSTPTKEGIVLSSQTVRRDVTSMTSSHLGLSYMESCYIHSSHLGLLEEILFPWVTGPLGTQPALVLPELLANVEVHQDLKHGPFLPSKITPFCTALRVAHYRATGLQFPVCGSTPPAIPCMLRLSPACLLTLLACRLDGRKCRALR